MKVHLLFPAKARQSNCNWNLGSTLKVSYYYYVDIIFQCHWCVRAWEIAMPLSMYLKCNEFVKGMHPYIVWLKSRAVYVIKLQLHVIVVELMISTRKGKQFQLNTMYIGMQISEPWSNIPAEVTFNNKTRDRRWWAGAGRVSHALTVRIARFIVLRNSRYRAFSCLGASFNMEGLHVAERHIYDDHIVRKWSSQLVT